MKIFKKALAIVFVSGLLIGCHTMQGVGQDVSTGGHALTRAAS